MNCYTCRRQIQAHSRTGECDRCMRAAWEKRHDARDAELGRYYGVPASREVLDHEIRQFVDAALRAANRDAALRGAAWHESGHAVTLASLAGIAPSVSIDPRMPGAGRTDYEFTAAEAGVPIRAAAVLGGPQAERRWAPDSPLDDGWDGDADKLWQLVSTGEVGTDAALRCADRALDANADLVAGLAGELLRHHRLTGRDVEGLLSDVVQVPAPMRPYRPDEDADPALWTPRAQALRRSMHEAADREDWRLHRHLQAELADLQRPMWTRR